MTEDLKSKNELIESLIRWVEIANNMHQSGDWNKASLLHVFSDRLSYDLSICIDLLSDKCKCGGTFRYMPNDLPYSEKHFQCNSCDSTKNFFE